MGHRVLLASAFAGLAALSSATAADTTANGIDLVVDVNVDAVFQDLAQSAAYDIRRSLQHIAIECKIAATGSVATIRLSDASRLVQARAVAEAITSGEHDRHKHRIFTVSTASDGSITLTMIDTYKAELIHDVVARAREVFARRAREVLGTAMPVTIVEKSRIAAKLTGKHDYGPLLNDLQPLSKLTLRMVVDVAEGMPSPDGVEWLELSPRNGAKPARIAVEKHVLIDGEHIRDAGWTHTPDTNEVVVTARFDDEGTQAFADITKANVGKSLAVVMGNKVLTAPTIREPILGGLLQISGDFTVETANDLAVLIRTGALPAPLIIAQCSLKRDDGHWEPCLALP